MIYRHHAREVAAQLTMREFTVLCSYIDAQYGPNKPGRTQLVANGFHYFSNTLEVKASKGAVKFNVLDIRRDKKLLWVYVDLGGGVLKNFDMSDVIKENKKAA